MSARHFRRKRWEQWNRRPGTRALASQGRRERFTSAELDGALDTSMEAGRIWGRREGERDLFRALADDFVLREDAIPEDLIALAAYVGVKALGEEVGTFLLAEGAWRRDPDRMRQIADAVELGGEEGRAALEAIAREMGVFPDGERDDLLDVAEAAGATPLDDAAPIGDEVEQWLREHGGQPDDKDGGA